MTDDLLRVLTLADYNTRVVILGTSALGTACGAIGSFMLLRKRSLMADAVSHATLPGIAIAFIVMVSSGGSGKWLPGLLLGALLSGLLGMGIVLFLRNQTRIKEDAALGIVLSCFFGLGVSLLGVIQKMSRGSAAGLESFIYGKTASMLRWDAYLIGITAIVSLALCLLLFKEFTLLCFDQQFAASIGYPTVLLDLILMSLVVLVTVIGLQAVGLILVIALLIIPPASARFWTDRLSTMALISAFIGASGSALGAATSSVVPRLPAGAVIVVTYSLFFGFSLLFGRRNGLIMRLSERRRNDQKIGFQNLVRAFYEHIEATRVEEFTFDELLSLRSWHRSELQGYLSIARRRGAVEKVDGRYRLSGRGQVEARRIVRNYRLWEMYLITHADIAPSHVDRNADTVEHILDPKLINELEALVLKEHPEMEPPQAGPEETT